LAELAEFAACSFHDPLKVGHELSVDRVVGRAEGLNSPLAGREEDQEEIPLLNFACDEHPLAG
jgi:hypothetical protein